MSMGDDLMGVSNHALVLTLREDLINMRKQCEVMQHSLARATAGIRFGNGAAAIVPETQPVFPVTSDRKRGQHMETMGLDLDRGGSVAGNGSSIKRQHDSDRSPSTRAPSISTENNPPKKVDERKQGQNRNDEMMDEHIPRLRLSGGSPKNSDVDAVGPLGRQRRERSPSLEILETEVTKSKANELVVVSSDSEFEDNATNNAEANKFRFCTYCGMKFAKPADCLAHQVTIHKKRMCNDCERVVCSADKLEKLKNARSKRYYSRDYMKTAVGAKRQRQRPDFCTICDKQFKSERTLLVHMVKTHRGANYCNICEEEFPNSHAFTVHWKEEHIFSAAKRKKLFRCQFCPEAFLQLRSKNKHVREKHPQLRCKICCCRFKQSRYMLDHVRRKHQLQVRLNQFPIRLNKLILPSDLMRSIEAKKGGRKGNASEIPDAHTTGSKAIEDQH